MDNVEAVTYFSRTTEPLLPAQIPTPAGVLCEHAVRELLGKSTVGGETIIRQQTEAFHISQVELGSVTPKIGDTIVDAAGMKWTVQPGLDGDLVTMMMWRLPVVVAAI